MRILLMNLPRRLCLVIALLYDTIIFSLHPTSMAVEVAGNETCLLNNVCTYPYTLIQYTPICQQEDGNKINLIIP